MTDTTAPQREHSDIVGGSNAGRMIGCPGHYGIIQRMQVQLDLEADNLIDAAQEQFANGTPQMQVAITNAEELRRSLNKSSSYADEGTALHTIMEYLVDNDVPLAEAATDPQVVAWFADGVPLRDGSIWELHPDRMLDAVIPAYEQFNTFLDEILAEDGEEFMVAVENRVDFPGIDASFGTCDVLIRTTKRTVVWDWKFGVGVPVYASYTIPAHTRLRPPPDGDMEPQEVEVDEETFGNDQLSYYGRAAMNTKPEYFEEGDTDWPVELVICQPRVRDEISRYTSTVGELLDFEADLVEAVEEALHGAAPSIKKGKWCDFAACKTQCPLHAGSAPRMARFGDQLRQLHAMRAADAAPVPLAEERVSADLSYPEALGLMLDMRDMAEEYFREAEKQAHAFMEAGGKIPGRKLVPKRAGHDGWKDAEKVDAFLGRRGLDTAERRKSWEPITPAAARKVLKAKKDEKGLKLLEDYVQPGVSSGTNIAPSDDPRPEVVSNAETIGSLADKLRQSLEQ